MHGRAVREAVLAHRPALPFMMIAEAVACILGPEQEPSGLRQQGLAVRIGSAVAST